jgi:transcriptional regulator of arginine metabolism
MSKRLSEASKRERHSAILDLVRSRTLPNQQALRAALLRRGIHVAQATLSRDLRELGLVKQADSGGRTRYRLADEEAQHAPTLQRLLPDLFESVEGTSNLLLVRTLIGGAQAVALALDREQWPEVLGTVAGDDTILVILRRARDLRSVQQRLEKLARPS